jgi:hypothetical protein
MQVHHLRRVTIELRDDEIDSLREVCVLAHRQLTAEPPVQMSGYPMKKQAGLVGPELFRVKTMLQEFGISLGADLPYDTKHDSYPVATLAQNP